MSHKNSHNKKIHYKELSEKWTNKHKELQEIVKTKHKDAYSWLLNNSKQMAIGSLSGLMLLTTTPQVVMPATDSAKPKTIQEQYVDLDPEVFYLSDLSKIVPTDVRPLTADEEKNITHYLSNKFGMKVSAELDGKRLERNYGLIGAEQHLMRYPGDNMSRHFTTSEDAALYGASGMAPGRGAWGYFASSADQMSQKDIDREKYYLAIQTFLAPGYQENPGEYSKFFKYRKMLIVNPNNGKAMVVCIGDAGPAVWTGKHLGGSPEVMKYLDRHDGRQRGPVLYFFIDDPEDKIPLGPIETSQL
jgi:hypothetical protein